MIKTIELTCVYCGKIFDRKLADHNRNIRNGLLNTYCSNKCSGKNSHTHLRKYSYNISDWVRENGNPKQKDEFSLFRPFLKRINNKDSSKGGKRKPNIDIDLKYLKDLWEKQNGLCDITKIPMLLKYHSGLGPTNPYQASLDRIDSSLPYQQGNVRFICLIVNYARNGFSDQQVTEFIKNANNNYNSLL